MKRRLLAAVAAAAVIFGTVQPSYALFGAGDIVFDPSNYAELVAEAKNGVEQLKWLTDLYGDAEKSLAQLTQFYNLFAHMTNVTQMAAVLNSQFLKSPMLADALQMEQAFRGFGLQTSLAGKIQNILGQARYYAPSNTDFTGWHLNTRATATAGQISSAQDAYTSSTQRVTGLSQLMTGINTSDPKQIADIQARASIETGTAVAQTNQLLSGMIMQQANRDAQQQQQEQAFRYSLDQSRAQQGAAMTAASGGIVNLVTQGNAISGFTGISLGALGTGGTFLSSTTSITPSVAEGGSFDSATELAATGNPLPVPPMPPTDAPVDEQTGSCVVTDGQECGGITMDDTAAFDPSVNQTGGVDPTPYTGFDL